MGVPHIRAGTLKWRRVLFGVGSVGVALLTSELVLRKCLGYGESPRLIDDPGIEYRLEPSRQYSRFGKRVRVNRWSMRGPDLQSAREPGETRVLVIGDSVVFGGDRIDQDDLATVRAERELAKSRPSSRVANAAAPSWGPPNQLAYVRRFGTFDAQVVVLLLSSHDYGDVPRPGGSVQRRVPYSAVVDAAQRLFSDAAAESRVRVDPSPAEIAAALDALQSLLRLIAERGGRPVVLLHPTMAELQGPVPVGHQREREVAESLGVRCRSLVPELRRSVEASEAPYLDDIHLSARGQAVLARVIVEEVERELAQQ